MWGFPGGAVIKNLPTSAGDARDVGLIPGLGRFWSRKWQPTSVFLPGKYYGQRSLKGYSPWGRKESDMTECVRAHTPTHTHTHQLCAMVEVLNFL